MRSTLMRRAQSAAQPWRQANSYKNFKSAYGPQYKIGPHVAGVNMTSGANYAVMAGGFGAAAGIFALFFFGGVPRVQKDILSKAPLIGDYFVHEIAPEDNPF